MGAAATSAERVRAAQGAAAKKGCVVLKSVVFFENSGSTRVQPVYPFALHFSAQMQNDSKNYFHLALHPLPQQQIIVYNISKDEIRAGKSLKADLVVELQGAHIFLPNL